jgi:hypothetical protein
MINRPAIYGLVAEFDQPEPLIEAARRARDIGYVDVDAYTPFPVEELVHTLGLRKSSLPLFALIGAVVGAGGAYLLLWYSSSVDYPWNVAGRPLHSWPSYVPITFELGILGAAAFIFAAVFVLNRFPMPYHPISNVPAFRRASRDRFFLCIRSTDPRFDAQRTREFLQSLHSRRVDDVPW